MKRILKWTTIGLGSVVALALVVIYGVAELGLRQKFDVAAAPIGVPTDSAALARGRHVYETRGCEGCHGPGLTGKVFFDDALISRLTAPNVPAVLTGYSDADLARLLRHGVRPNGTGVAVMPSSMFTHLSDEDLGALIAYVRTLPVRDSAALPATSIRLLGRIGLLVGEYKLEPDLIDHDVARVPSGSDPAARGLYLAKSSCTECHGQDLQGDTQTPALSIVAGYSAAEFARLMREGVPKDGRTLELMGGTARNRFSHFTVEEVDALYAYLSTPLTAASPRLD